MDFADFPKSNTYFGGSERKVGVLISGHEYMIKFRKRDEFRLRNNHISEYLGSHIFALLGMEAQETYLGTYKGEEVVACRNFLEPEEQFVPFNEVGESTLEHDKEAYQYEYNDIMRMLHDNSRLTNVQDTVSAFWDMFIIDALIGNFDRHGANWGFVKRNRSYTLAPIFDNGSCLFPNMTDEDEMKHVVRSTEETEKRVYRFPASQIKLHGQKSSYYDVISSLEFGDANAALVRVYERADLDAIRKLVDSVELASETLKQFYHHMIEARFTAIIAEPYHELTGGFYEK